MSQIENPDDLQSIENPDDLQSIANHPGFFVYMTIFVYNGNNRKETVIELPRLNLKFRFFNGLKLGILGTRHTCQSSSSLSW